MVARELALIRVAATPNNARRASSRSPQVFRANVIDVAHDSLILEVTGDEDKIEALYELLLPYGVKELVRTGRIAMARGGAGSRASTTVTGATAPPAKARPR